MGNQTENLNLYLTDMNNDGNDLFDFDRDLNQNWNKIDNAIALKQDRLIAGEGVNLKNNIISILNNDSSSRIYDSGISTDAEGYKKVYDLKHSLFDRSKVTVVGNPTLTDDGILSNCSSSNYITTPTIKMGTNWTIDCEFIINSHPKPQQIFRAFVGSSFWGQIYVTPEGRIKVDFLPASEFGIGTVQLGAKYHVRIVQQNGTLASYIGVNGGELERVNSQTRQTTSSDNVYFRFGSGLNSNYALTSGSINLNQFSIKVEDAEVYTPLKTGIDTVKPNDYTVVGNPVITPDGAASGFSTGDYITTTKIIDFNNATTWQLDFCFTTPSAFGTDNSLYSGNASYNGIRHAINSTGKLSVAFSSITTGYDIGVITGLQLAINTKYYSRVKFDGTKYTLSYSLDGTNYDVTGTPIASSTKIQSAIGYIGVNNNRNTPMQGSIDLNSFKIYVDGELAYQPCLKIPYTEAKTGAKIVDAQYRDRVQDWYEQSGEGNYYTIDEDNKNFTLALPDIYGLIENNHQNLPIGMTFPCMCSAEYAPYGALPCDGTEYTKAQFPELWNNWLISGKLLTCSYSQYQADITAYGKCGKFAVDTTNNKFKVPLIPDGTHIQQALNDSELGKAYKAGLPNITGSFDANGQTSGANANGAFSGVQLYSGVHSGNGGASENTITLDASRSSSIYGNANTVQPSAIAYRWFVVVATGTFNKSQMDWAQYISALAGKANVSDLNNRTQRYVVEKSDSALLPSWYIVYNDGWKEQGGTAQENTTVSFLKPFTNTNYSVLLTIADDSNNYPIQYRNKTLNSIVLKINNDNSGTGTLNWYTCGY